MKSFDIKVGYTCNNDCIHCVVSNNRDRIQPGDNHDRSAENIIDELSRVDRLDNIVITGGEPSIRKDMVDILRRVKEIHPRVKVMMQTNGRGLSDKRLVENIHRMFPDMNFSIALHSDEPHIHNKITQRKDSYEETIEGIKNIINENMTLHGKMVISYLNAHKITDVIRKFFDLGAKGVNVAYPHGSGNAWRYREKVMIKYSECVRYVCNSIKEHKDKNISFEAFPLCMLPGHEEYISDLAYVNGGESYVLHVEDKTPSLWNNLILLNKYKPEGCDNCSYDSICLGVWDDYFKYRGCGELKPVSDGNVELIIKKYYWRSRRHECYQ